MRPRGREYPNAIQTVLSDEQLALLDAYCEREHRARSNAMREILMRFLEQEQKQDARKAA